MPNENLKELVGKEAAKLVKDGMVIGLGTGAAGIFKDVLLAGFTQHLVEILAHWAVFRAGITELSRIEVTIFSDFVGVETSSQQRCNILHIIGSQQDRENILAEIGVIIPVPLQV